MNTVISIAPLSQQFKKRLEKDFSQAFNYITVSQLRQNSIGSMLKQLRSLGAELIIAAIEDHSSLSALPIIITLVGVAKAKQKLLVTPDLQKQPIRFFSVISSLCKMICASIKSAWISFRCYRKLQTEHHSNNSSTEIKNINRCFYINANLWFGVKAGGSVGHISGVVNGFANRCEIIYASICDNFQIHDNIPRINIQPLKDFGLPSELNYYRFSRQVTKQLLPEIKKYSPDFIYQRMSVCNYSGAELSRKTNIPLVIEYNGSEVWCAEKWGRGLRYPKLALLAETSCLQQAHTIVTISKVLERELIERKIPKEKIVCYPNCVDPLVFNPNRFSTAEKNHLRDRYNIPEDAFVLTFIGTFGSWHGVDVLAKTIRQLIDHESVWLKQNKVHFLLVGDGQKMPEVQKTLNMPDDKHFVTLTGLIPQDQAAIYLAASNILLSPHVPNPDGSEFFGSPTKLFEYMAMGKPIIASKLGQIAEVLNNSLHASSLINYKLDENTDKLAILAEPGNITELINAIKFLFDNPKWQNLFEKNVCKEASEKYTWQHHVEAVIQSVLNQKRGYK